jgi:hypothetical protein
MRIDFPDGAAFNFDRGAVAFPAVVDGVNRQCLISTEALEDHFGADHGSNFVYVYERNKYAIQQVARRMLEQGASGEVVIKSGHF